MSVFPKRRHVETAVLPDHAIVVDRRARRIHIRVTPEDGVVVRVPRSSDVRHVPRVLLEHAAWVERALERTAPRRAHLASAASSPLPGLIDLPGIGLRFAVEYRASAAKGVRASTRSGTVIVSGEIEDEAACRAALRRWVARMASEYLPRSLDRIAREEGLQYRGARVRAQRTRWGSCTRDSRISLNRSLVFLQPDQVRYVMVHELLHTVRHDHSPAFWALVAERVPDAPAVRRGLHDAWVSVPPWASERLGFSPCARVP